MADGDVLREFLVGLRIKGDEPGLRSLQEGVQSVGQAAQQLVNGLNQMAKALTGVAGSGGAAAQASKTTRAFSADVGEGIKKVAEFGAVLFTASGILTAYVKHTADHLDQLYWVGQRTRNSTTDLLAYTYAMRNAGVASGAALGAMEGFNRALEDPGLRALFSQLYGVNVAPGKGGTAQQLYKIVDELAKLYRGPNPWLAIDRAEETKIPGLADLVRQAASNPNLTKQLQKDQEENEKMIARVIGSSEKLDAALKKIRDSESAIGLGFTLIKAAVLEEFGDAIVSAEKFVAHAIPIFGEFNKQFDGWPVKILAVAAALWTAGAAIRFFRLGFGGLATGAAVAGGGGGGGAGWLAALLPRIAPWVAGLYAFRPHPAGTAGEDEAAKRGLKAPTQAEADAATAAARQQKPLSWWDMYLKAARDAVAGRTGHGEIVPLPPPDAVLPSGGGVPSGKKVSFGDSGGELSAEAILTAFMQMMGDWLRGGGGFRPTVVIAEEYYAKFSEMLRSMFGIALGGGDGATPGPIGRRPGGRFGGMGGLTGGSRAAGALSYAAMKQLALAAGFTGQDADIAAAIGMAESGGNPNLMGAAGEFGIMQIHPVHPGAEGARDPKRAMEMAFGLYKARGGFRDWSTYNDGKYRQYLGGAGGGKDDSGVNKALVDAWHAAAATMPEGIKAAISSAFRPGDPRFHGKGLAIDTQLSGPGGPIRNRGGDVTGLYTRFAHAVYNNLPPELRDRMGYGGEFNIPGTNDPDIMHVDLGGRRGRLRRNDWAFPESRLGGEGRAGAGSVVNAPNNVNVTIHNAKEPDHTADAIEGVLARNMGIRPHLSHRIRHARPGMT